MGRMSPAPVEDAHAYTRSDVPWSLSVGGSSYDRMINYLSGGGMRTFGRTVRQEQMRRRQNRFLAIVAVLAVLWFVFWIF